MTMDAWWRDQGDLDEDQRNVIGLPDEGSYLVFGPPGSGKTNLLLLRANYLATVAHPNLAVVVFNRTLCEFIRSGSDNYAFDPRKVQTSAALLDSIIREAGGEYEAGGTFREVRLARIQAAERVMARIQTKIYDVLLLDEGQDFLPQELALFRRISEDFFVVADSRQQIYDSISRLDLIGEMVDERLPLRYHYRSGNPICEVADDIGKRFTSLPYEPILPTCNYDPAIFRPSVDVFQGTLEEQVQAIERRLIAQRRAYPEGFLGVITPRVQEVRAIAAILERGGLADQICVQTSDFGYEPITADRPIWLSTVHGAKGLEFRAVHFAAADKLSTMGDTQKRLAYTGVTRAKTVLSIYHDRAMPGYIDAAVQKFRSVGATRPGIGAAFGRR